MAVRIDAAADRLTHSGAYPQTSAGWTVTAWVRIDVDRNDWSTFVRTSQGGGTVANVSTASDGTQAPAIYTAAGSVESVFDLTSPATGVWACIAGTRSASTGDFTAWRKRSGAGSTESATLDLATTDVTGTPDEICVGGRSSADPSEWFNGSVAYVRIWSAELSQAEIEAEWASAVPVRTSGLHSNWPLVDAADLTDTVAGKTLTTQSGGSPSTTDGPTGLTGHYPYLIDSSIQGGVSSSGFTTSSFTPADGELLIVKTGSWDSANNPGVPSDSAGALDWVRVAVEPGGSFNGQVQIWAAQVGTSPGAITVSTTAPSTNCHHILALERWGDAEIGGEALAGSNFTNSSSAPSVAITPPVDNSVITFVGYDNNSANPSGRAYLNGATEVGISSPGGVGVFYSAYQAAATAGPTTFGMSAPSGQRWNMAGVVLFPAGQVPGVDPNPHWVSSGSARTGSTSTPSFTVPTGVQDKSVVVIAMYVGNSNVSSGLNLPAGWDYAPDGNNRCAVTGQEFHQVVIWHRAEGPEFGTYDFTLDASSFVEGAASRYESVITSGSPWDSDTDFAVATASASTSPGVSIITDGGNRIVLHAGFTWAGGTWTAPAGYSKRFQPAVGESTLSDKQQAAAGSTGTLTAAMSNASVARGAWVGALLPELAGEVVVVVVGAALPTLQGPLAGSVVSPGAVAGALPAPGGSLTGALGASGQLSGLIPGLTGLLTGTSRLSGVISGSLPNLMGSFADFVAVITGSSVELRVQRKNTKAFISADPIAISLRTRQAVRTATGGVVSGDGPTRSSQTFKLIMQSPAGNSIEQRTEDGTERQIDFILLGEWDAEVEVGDHWDDAQGNRWEVRALIPTNDYETRAVVEAHGKILTGG